jgi:hypothetical protein
MTYPGVNPDPNMIAMINAFLDWAQEQPNGMCSSRLQATALLIDTSVDRF